MHEICEWISKAAQALGITCTALSSEISRTITDRAQALYVQDNPRAWWMSLKWPAERFDSHTTRLERIIPPTLHCWLIPETDQRDLPVFELLAADIPKLLDECPFFEYYILARNFAWLICESDHNHFYLCHAPSPMTYAN